MSEKIVQPGAVEPHHPFQRVDLRRSWGGAYKNTANPMTAAISEGGYRVACRMPVGVDFPSRQGQKLPDDFQARVSVCIDADGIGNIAGLLVDDYNV